MYQVGDYIAYNEEGVCRVEDIGALSIPSADPDKLYYFLRTVTGDGRIFVPTDTPLPMRPVLSREEALALIRRMPGISVEISRFSNKRMLEEHYRELMKPHTPEALVRIIKSAHEKRWQVGGKPKSLNATDEYYRKRAEAMLYPELAMALGIPVDRVEQFICDSLGERATGA